jgi:hypothetical protein
MTTTTTGKGQGFRTATSTTASTAACTTAETHPQPAPPHGIVNPGQYIRFFGLKGQWVTSYIQEISDKPQPGPQDTFMDSLQVKAVDLTILNTDYSKPVWDPIDTPEGHFSVWKCSLLVDTDCIQVANYSDTYPPSEAFSKPFKAEKAKWVPGSAKPCASPFQVAVERVTQDVSSYVNKQYYG